ncbi:MAG: universal stress protein [Chloroflexaceae bacterium]|nr:universal stress protein [Chloroflexaceae bacterium]
MGDRKILVAIAPSPQTPLILAKAAQLAAGRSDSQLLVLYCLNWEDEGEAFVGLGTLVDVDVTGASLKNRRDRLHHRVEEAEGWLQEICRELPPEISKQWRCEVGDPGTQICQLAGEWQADLIIIGRRGLQGLTELLLGSVSNYVVHHAPCSVLVVHSEISRD